MTVAPYKDGVVTNDHSYYGRGCKNSWGTSGEGGSQTPCADSDAGGRFVKTADNETQKNGTYYNFQAANSGSGTISDADNTNTPDTFCPLGWQMPYSGTGGDYYDKSKSWRYLFTTYSIGFDIGTAADATKLASYPFSYVYSGGYYWSTGRLYLQTLNGVYSSSTGSNGSYALHTAANYIQPALIDSKIFGEPARCDF